MQHALLVALVASSYLLFAGGPRWTVGPLLGIAVLAVLAAPYRTLRFARAYRPLDAALVAILIAIGVQLVPLPVAVVQVLSPHAASVQEALRFSGLQAAAPAWRPLSINPAGTTYALGTAALGVLAFWIARGLFEHGGQTRTFARVLGVLGVTAAAVALAQRVLTPKLVLGLLQPATPSASPFGAFTNRNHFAAWLLMVATVAAGYLIAHWRIHAAYRRGWRSSMRQFLASGAMVTSVAVFVMVGTLLMTLSRSALAGLGAAGLTGWFLGRDRISIERSQLPAVFGLAGVALLVAVVFVDVDGWAARMEHTLNTEGGRATIWLETLPVVRDFAWTGTGAGTYSDAMVRYQQSRVWVGSMQQWVHFNNAHSHYLQVAAEGGLLLVAPALAAGLCFIAAGRRAIGAAKGEMRWVRVGAAAGLIGVAVQSVWEVALTMPANAVLCGALAGLLVYRRDNGDAGDAPGTPDALPETP